MPKTNFFMPLVVKFALQFIAEAENWATLRQTMKSLLLLLHKYQYKIFSTRVWIAKTRENRFSRTKKEISCEVLFPRQLRLNLHAVYLISLRQN